MSAPDATRIRPATVDDPARPLHDRDDEEVSAVGLLNVALRHRGLILGLAILLGGVVGVLTITRPREYASTATFVPQTPAGGAVSGLAAQFGLAVGAGGDPARSPQFYVDLTRSREILGRVADTRYTFRTDTGTVSATGVDLFAPASERRPAFRREAAIARLGERIKSRVTAATSVIEVTAKARDPRLASAVAGRVVELINEFNLQRRQSQAAAEREFTFRRLEEVRGELRQAENRFETFLQGNRGFQSPALLFEQDRLRRAVALQQQLFITLAEAYEQAKIDEVRDTPVITVIEAPETPIRPEPRGTVRKAVLAALGGALVGLALAFGLDFSRRIDDDGSPEYAEFRALKRATVDDLKHPWRPLARLVRPRRHARHSPHG